MKVCSLHFREDDYFNKGQLTKKGRLLKSIAVPSQNLPEKLGVKIRPGTSSERSERYKNRNLRDDCENDSCCFSEHCEADIVAAEALLDLCTSGTEITDLTVDAAVSTRISNMKPTRDSSVQVDTPRICTLCDLLMTDNALRSFTGIHDMNMLDCLETMIQEVLKDIRTHRLTIRQRIILTMTKLKLDLSYQTLAILFSISPQVCKTYFVEMLTTMSSVLSPIIYFPTMEEISKNIPKCFEQFKNTRIVLDCTEIFVQRPKCLCCRIKFDSQYKSNCTVKFMTGVSPAGLISFISDPYGGRASDKMIIEQSGLIDKLTANVDSIMVDKGFNIKDYCATNGIKIIQPPFLRNKKQLTPTESLQNQQIAAARVHIERSNQWIKIFKLLRGTLEWRLVPYIKDIFIIACGITNLSSPILADERF